ncbi:capsular polysaccharide export protein, LipB/KpsS family [Pseudomonas sp. EL_65y_Pfl2_R96]|uniref:capsular polysaccharide export protein, LipB/KpsS family n=1 Tax=Pseudomonas sp. EL_65y_Pfl2_R96 TaxID=3088699 RepID=UPI0030D72C3C
MVNRTVQWLIAPEVSGDEPLLLFSACDAGYLGYAISLIKSVDLYSPGATFFLHVINPGADTVSRIGMLSRCLVSTRLSVSFETIDLSALNTDQQRAYYASARFLQLSNILSVFSVPVFSIDADSLVVNPFDFDFSNKTDADVIIVRRNLAEDQPEHLAIATGSIWLAPSERIIRLLREISSEIDKGVVERSLEWFVDQRLFFRQMNAYADQLKFYNLKRKYADWTFSTSSILWAGKGGLKLYDLRFFLLQNLLCDDAQKRNISHHLAEEFFTVDNSLANEWIRSRIATAVEGKYLQSLGNRSLNLEASTRNIAFYIPRLDRPWRRMPATSTQFPVVSDDVIDLRLRWKEFAVRMANALERAGLTVNVIELPGWEIDRERIDADGAALAFVPHRCHLNFLDGKTPVLFYMQEFFRWAFVVDGRGWSAASSVYPVARDINSDKAQTSFDEYRARLVDGRLASKFAQQAAKSKRQLIDEGLLPFDINGRWFPRRTLRPYIFFPLQVPTDQSIQLFSDFSEQVLVESLVEWAKENGVTVVLKPHPANMKSMKPFEKMVDNTNVFYSEANVQDLIAHATAVYTINSGVGFEALLQVKPVVTFGRVEYDCVTFNATPTTLDEAWGYVQSSTAAELEVRYKNFVDWFLECYAVDMSQPQASKARLDEIAAQVLSIISPSVVR